MIGSARSSQSPVPGVQCYYTCRATPSAMVVEVFLREKRISSESIQAIERHVDIGKLENRGAACKKMNPEGSVPWLTTPNGQCIAESIAMCEYIEEQIAQPALIGSCPAERARTRMWQRRMEEHFCYPARHAHRTWCHSEDCPQGHRMKGFYAQRCNPEQGSFLLYSAPGAWKDLAAWALNRIKWLETTKQSEAKGTGKLSAFICGDNLTMVDIQVYVNMFFADTANPGLYFFESLKGQVPWVEGWYNRMHARPAVVAARRAAGFQDRADPCVQGVLSPPAPPSKEGI